MAVRKPLTGTGDESPFIRGLRAWGGEVADAVNGIVSRGAGDDLTGGAAVSGERPFDAYWAHRERYSVGQPLEIPGGFAYTRDGVVFVEGETWPWQEGTWFVYLEIIYESGGGSEFSASINIGPSYAGYEPSLYARQVLLGMVVEVDGVSEYVPAVAPGDIYVDDGVTDYMDVTTPGGTRTMKFRRGHFVGFTTTTTTTTTTTSTTTSPTTSTTTSTTTGTGTTSSTTTTACLVEQHYCLNVTEAIPHGDFTVPVGQYTLTRESPARSWTAPGPRAGAGWW